MASKILQIPELASLVLSHVDQPRTVACCARVNRYWHGEAEAILWEGASGVDVDDERWRTPNVEVLTALAHDFSRFRHCVGLIRHLQIMWGTRNDADIEAMWHEELWKTARFVSVEVDIGSAHMFDKRMKLLLQPNIRYLRLYGR